MRSARILLIVAVAGHLGTSIGSDQSNDPHRWRAYSILGLGPNLNGNFVDLTQEDIDRAFAEKSKDVDPVELARLQVAHFLLSDPKNRTLYDTGKASEIELQLNQKSLPFDPAARDTKIDEPKTEGGALKKSVKFTAGALTNMGTFYLAVALAEMRKSLQSADPEHLNSYIQSLKDPLGHIGFGIFVGSSHLATSAFNQATKNKYISGLGPGFIGMATGSLFNEIFSEIANHPEMEKYFKARLISDPIERNKKQNESLSNLYNETFGNKTWIVDKTPSIAALIAAATASHFTTKLSKSALNEIKRLARPSDPATKDCGLSAIQDLQKIILQGNEKLIVNKKGALKTFLKARAHEIPGILLFLAWSDLLTPPIKGAWDRLTLDTQIHKNRLAVYEDHEQGKGAPVQVDIKKLETWLNSQELLWDRFRQAQLREALPSLMMHSKSLEKLKRELQKPSLFYHWLLDNGSERSAYYEQIKKNYYSDSTKMAEIEMDARSYLRGFFCGPHLKDSFYPAKNMHGLSVPGSIEARIEPYRMTTYDSIFCSQRPSDEFYNKCKSKLKSRDWTREITVQGGRLNKLRYEVVKQKTQFFESLMAREILKNLGGIQKSQEKGLVKVANVRTVLDLSQLSIHQSLQVEMEDLLSIRQGLSDPVALQRVQEKLLQLAVKKQAVETLIQYFEANANDRSLPEFVANLEAEDAVFNLENPPQWRKAVQFFNSFILH